MFTWEIGNEYQVLGKGYSMKKEWALEDAIEAAKELRKQTSYPVIWSVKWAIGNAKTEIWDVIE